MNDDESILKICIVGSPTELSNKLVRSVAENTFTENYILTQGVDICHKQIQVEGHPVKFILMSLASQSFYARIRRSFYQGIWAAVITFDKGDRNSFNQVSNYYHEVRESTDLKVGIEDGRNITIPLALIGIITGADQVGAGEGLIFAEEREMLYYELLLQEREKILQIFRDLAKS